MKKTRATFWFVIIYILAAFSWWTYAHISSNQTIHEQQRELLEMRRLQASRDVYANLIEGKYAQAGQNISLRMSGRYFFADTALINNFFKSVYPDLTFALSEEEGILVVIKANSLEKLNRKENIRNVMFLGEGLVFMGLLLWGFVIIYRSYQEKDELNRMQANFIMSVTHELKTPLASAKLMLQTMLKRQLAVEQQHKLVDNSLSEINRLDSLIEKILLASKFEHHNQLSQRRSINLSELCRDVVERMSHTQRFDGRLFAEIDDNVTVNGDVALLVSVLTNLIENAAKYSDEGTPIRVSLFINQQTAFLQVIDHGHGISDIDKKLVFKKFYRVGNEETRTTKGTGLGLYIVKNIVTDLGGDIQVKDNRPKGSIFEITMPAIEYELQDTFS
jgi:signal transduction histidine kinase